MSALTGTGTLVRLGVRRDRILVPCAALALTAFSVGSARATVALYPDPAAAMHDLGAVLTSPSTLALYGPASTTSLAGLSIFKTLLVGAILLGLLSFVIVRRHTRIEEEEGRFELIGAGAVGRQAPLAAAVALAAAATLLTAALSAIGLIAIGFPVAGSLGFGVAWTIPGLLMTGVTAIACQLTASARGAAGWALGALALLFALRAIGDTATTQAVQRLRWLSPLGWVNQVFPFARDRIWLGALSLVVAGCLVGIAFALLERRDLGAGLLASRRGPATAPASLSGPGGLLWRLTRPAVLGWGVAIALVGLLYGGLVPQVGRMLADASVRELLAQMAGVPVAQAAGALTSLYAATMIQISAVALGAAGVAFVLRLAAEERSGHGEVVLATAVARTRWFLLHVIGAAVLVTGLSLLLALVMGARGHAASPDAPTVAWTVQAALETVPANLVILGCAALLTGSSPRWAPAAWGVLGLAFLLGEFGTTMNLPTWLSDVSPYAHVTTYPMGQWQWTQVIVLTLVAIVLTCAGLARYRRRDLA